MDTTTLNSEEEQYLNLVATILNRGVQRNDRTGAGTKSIFATSMRFSLANNTVPLLTSRKVFWRGVVEELLWIMSGSTDATVLSQKNIHIWDGNSSRSFLDLHGLHDYKEGDIGPGYGFQWRHFGAKYNAYKNSATETDVVTETDRIQTLEKDAGVDQLRDCIDKMLNDPYNRRIIISAWNPLDIPKMALPPCHLLCQFYVDMSTTPPTLSSQMYQRSADVALGVPFNIASYSLLTILLAHVCGMQPGEFVHVIGDAHIYNNHEEGMQTLLARRGQLRPWPRVHISDLQPPTDRTTDATLAVLLRIQSTNITLIDYNPLPPIRGMTMAV